MTGRVLRWCERQGFPLAGRHVLCAVSGGVDSMVLLHLLCVLRAQGVLTLTAATFDHRLRPGSGADAAFVVRWCDDHHIPCHTGAGDVAQWAEARGVGLELAGRRLRYDFLERVRTETGADYIATAHHADDNAETLLLHLLRGSGLHGLGGIPPRRGVIVRPLLELSRGEIAAYAKAEQIPFLQDESNGDIRYTRNFLRHQVMPLLRQCNPGLTATLSRTAESLRRDGDCLEAMVPEVGTQVSVTELNRLPPALALRLVQAMAEQAGSETVLTAAQREAVLALAAGESPSGQVSLPGGLTARRRYEILSLERESGPLTFTPFTLGDGESRYVPELGWTFRCGREIYAGETPGRLYLRWAGPGVTLRPRRTGDRLRLPRRGTKSVKKWMIEEKIPKDRRGLVPVAEIGGATAALWGMGRDEGWLPEMGQPCWVLWTEE